MLWLVVTGSGSWSPGVIGKTWEEPKTELAQGRWLYEAPTFQAGKHLVDERVREAAERSGYPDYVFFFEEDDEPELLPPDDTGLLKPEDIRSGTRSGVHLKVIEGGGEPEAVPVDEDVPLDFPCPNCDRAFPSAPSRDRHVEFDHTRRHEVLQKRGAREAEREAEEKAAIRRLQDAEEKLPPWEREVVEQAQPKRRDG